MQRLLPVLRAAAVLLAGTAVAASAQPMQAPAQPAPLLPAPAQPRPAQPSPRPGTGQPTQASRADQSFAAFAAQATMLDAGAGQLAAQRGASAQVKRLGQQLMTDQAGESDALQQIAQQDTLTLPNQLSPMQQAQSRRLNVLYGPEFDHAFVTAQIAHDAQAIALFQREAQSGRDPALKEFAQETLPVLRRHLALAESISSQTTSDEGTWRGQD